MSVCKRFGSVVAVAGLAAIGVAALPHDAKAWWHGGVGVGVLVPPVVVTPPPPAYIPPPVYVPPPGAYVAPGGVYAPGPVAIAPSPPYYVAPRRLWIPPHWEGPYWVRGHWS